jgi:hypothetical protein
LVILTDAALAGKVADGKKKSATIIGFLGKRRLIVISNALPIWRRHLM